MVWYQWASFGVKLVIQKWDDKIDNWVISKDPESKAWQRCLNRPNEYSSSGEFLFTIITNLLKDGNALISRVPLNGAYPFLFEVLHSDGVRPVLDKRDLVKGYQVTKQGLAGMKEKFVKREDMAHVRLPNSEHLEWGISPLHAAENVQDGETMAMAWNKSIMSNAGATSFVLTTKEPLSKVQGSALRKAIIEQTALEYAGMPLLLTHGVEPKSLGKSPADLNYVESSRLDLIRICSLLKVPPTLVDPSLGATQAEMTKMQRSFLTTSALPIIGHVCETMTHYWMLGKGGLGENYRIWYDASGAAELRESIDRQKLEFIDVLFNKGVSLNEINSFLELGLPPNIHTGNIRIINGVVIDWAGIEPFYDTEANPHNLGDARSQGVSTSLAENPDQGEASLPSASPGTEGSSKGTSRNKQGAKAVKAALQERDIVRIGRSIEKDRAYMKDVHQTKINYVVGEAMGKILQADFATVSKLENLGAWKTEYRENLARALDRLWFETATIFQQEFGRRYLSKAKKGSKALSLEQESEAHEIASTRAFYISDNATHWIIEFVQKRIERGLSEEEIIKELRTSVPQLTEFKAEVIVENEILAASNYGNYIGAEQSGVYTQKVWRTQRDLLVRDSHVVMEGEERLLSENYSNGLRFPCDPLGSPAETTNCRCFETYE